MVSRNYDFCISSYLTFRYVVKDGFTWKPGVMPKFPEASAQSQFKVKNAQEVLSKLREIAGAATREQNVGILLSGGMDSAIIAALFPPGTYAFTIQFIAEGAIDEVPAAQAVAERLQLKHVVVQVIWEDYQGSMDLLMKRKKSPLHPAEVGIYKAAAAAAAAGVKTLAVGNGADSTFGGMDKLLSRDWTYDEFVQRYTFLDPARAVKRPVYLPEVFEKYRKNGGFDVMGFLKVVHGLGIIQMFENAIDTAGCGIYAPFEKLALDAPLDLARIRRGDTKYLLREVFRELYPGLEIPDKIPFARPVTQWLQDWQGPTRPEFLENLSMEDFTGEQKWQLYCLERFLNLLDKKF